MSGAQRVGRVGLLANPASGKDVRRLVARASVFDNEEKGAIVTRAVIGALEAGARDFAYLDDRHGIVRRALSDAEATSRASAVEATATGSALDTVSAARALRDAGCAVVITLGGDGTNRAFVRGWRDACLLPVSTGTNNVFPALGEATIVGAAAGLVASRAVDLETVARQRKLIEVEIDGEEPDLALVDAVLTHERFIGARALLSPESLRTIVLTRAEPAAVGMTSIGGLLRPLRDDEAGALVLQIDPDAARQLRAPIAPGLYEDVGVASVEHLPDGEGIEVEGPGVLAFDGERERTLAAGQRARLRVTRSGPRVIDAPAALAAAAARGCYERGDAPGRAARSA